MAIIAQLINTNGLINNIATIAAILLSLYLVTWRWFKLSLKSSADATKNSAQAIKNSTKAMNKRIDDTNHNIDSLRTELHQGLSQMHNSLTLLMSARSSHQGVEQPHTDATCRGRLPLH